MKCDAFNEFLTINNVPVSASCKKIVANLQYMKLYPNLI